MKNQINAGNHFIALDFSTVDFIDSTGLGVLFSIHKDLKNKGGLAIANVSAGVKAVFKLTRMDKVFKIADSMDEAVSSLEMASQS